MLGGVTCKLTDREAAGRREAFTREGRQRAANPAVVGVGPGVVDSGVAERKLRRGVAGQFDRVGLAVATVIVDAVGDL